MKAPVILLIALISATFLPSSNAASQQDEMADAARTMEQTMAQIADFVKDVEFDEADVKSAIRYAREIDNLGNDGNDEQWRGDENEGDTEMIDFNQLLKLPEYRDWAKSRGLDADTWMKKFMRIQMLLMKTEMAGRGGQMNVQMETQLRELESQRAQMGEEMYQQMVQMMKMGSQMAQSASKAYADLPEPTQRERGLLQKYRSQLTDL